MSTEPARTSGSPMPLYPHYFSTYCIHHRHADCRLTCKTCEAPCQCPCHAEGEAPAG